MTAKQNNYTLGRGELHFARFLPGTTTPGPYRYLGNSPDVSFSSDVQRLDHYNSDRGIRVKDDSVILQNDFSGGLSLDDIQFENLAMMFLGSTAVRTSAGLTGQVETFTGVVANRSFQLGLTATDPVGARNITTVAIVDADTPATTYAAGTDYVLDPATGFITIPAGTAIPAGGSIKATWSNEGYSQDLVISGGTEVEGALRYVAKNPKGDQIDYIMPWVQLTADGDFALKGDDWQVMAMTMQILKKGSLEAVYAAGRPFATQ